MGRHVFHQCAYARAYSIARFLFMSIIFNLSRIVSKIFFEVDDD